jgi:hypothetical protein
MKVACSKASTNLCVELFWWYFDVDTMVALGMVYSQYWLCEKKYVKNLVMVQVLGLVVDKRPFNNLTYMP